MAYSKNSKIEAVDFNTIVGASNATTLGQLNAIWGVGNGNKGYGQTTVPSVNQGVLVSHTDWANLTNTTTSIASHQGTAITLVTTPATGALVEYNSVINTNLTTVSNTRLNATAQATSTPTSTSASTWSNQLTFTHTVTFSSGDHARYFFNAGGQLQLSFSSPSGSGINSLMNALGAASGQIILSSPSVGTATIAGTAYSGVTKVGGSGTPTTLSANSGYYALGTTDTVIFKQFATGTPSGYVGSYITVYAKTNGTVGANGDNGSVVTFTTVWDEVPNGLTVASGTSVTVTVRPPRSTVDSPSGYLTKTWGTPVVVGQVTGS
jgi:hypothetical protein